MTTRSRKLIDAIWIFTACFIALLVLWTCATDKYTRKVPEDKYDYRTGELGAGDEAQDAVKESIK